MKIFIIFAVIIGFASAGHKGNHHGGMRQGHRGSSHENNDMVSNAFRRNQLVSDVFNSAPQSFLNVLYPSNVQALLGNQLTTASTQTQPITNFPRANPNNYYTLVMVDPDATSRANPNLRNVLHWLVVNIKGNDFTAAYTFANYWGPAPPAGSGLHRYVFYYFKQTGVLDLTGTTPGTRLNFSLKDFAVKYNLGNPVAGNFFQAQPA